MRDVLLFSLAALMALGSVVCAVWAYRISRETWDVDEKRKRADRLARTVLGDEGPTVLQFPSEAARRGKR